jgi:hypothetical protein
MKFLFVMADYNDWRQQFFDDYVSPHNKAYCKKWGYEYLEVKDAKVYRGNHTWNKFKIPLDMIESHDFLMGDTITHIDADMAISLDHDLSFDKNFSYAIDSCNTHCMGFYSLKVNAWSHHLLCSILSNKRYEDLKDKKTIGSMNEYSSFWNIFREQASWYSLSGVKRHSWTPFFDLPNYGFHSEENKWTYYTLDELRKNVGVLPVEYNVTHIPEEDGDDKFYMNPCNKKPIIRHFAGGRKWRKEYYE